MKMPCIGTILFSPPNLLRWQVTFPGPWWASADACRAGTGMAWTGAAHQNPFIYLLWKLLGGHPSFSAELLGFCLKSLRKKLPNPVEAIYFPCQNPPDLQKPLQPGPSPCPDHRSPPWIPSPQLSLPAAGHPYSLWCWLRSVGLSIL